MNKTLKSNLYFYIALVCAVWFMLTGWFWAYAMNLFIAYPFGILSLIVWYKERNADIQRKKRYKIIATILVAGTIISLGSLISLLLFN